MPQLILDADGNTILDADNQCILDADGNFTCIGSGGSGILMAQICMWSFDDLIEWDQCQPGQ